MKATKTLEIDIRMRLAIDYAKRLPAQIISMLETVCNKKTASASSEP